MLEALDHLSVLATFALLALFIAVACIPFALHRLDRRRANRRGGTLDFTPLGRTRLGLDTAKHRGRRR